jgi:microcystin-dependent protein
MASPFIAELRIFSFGFAPRGWAICQGQILPINQNQALFSLLGTTYGGNGTSTFALPNLQGNVPVHFGQLQGGGNYVMGQVGGMPGVALNNDQTGHTHIPSANTVGTLNNPAGAFPAAAGGVQNFATATDGTTLAAAELPTFGGGQPHNNLQPLLVVNICIALQGIFPSRN